MTHQLRARAALLATAAAVVFGVPESSAAPTCAQTSPVPAAYSVPGHNDDGERVRLDLNLALDGITMDSARTTVATMTASYAALGIDVTARYRTLAIPADGDLDGRPTGEIARLMKTLMDSTDGLRPKGSDVVLLLTNKSLWIPGPNGERQFGWSGTAECLGGVQHPEQAFALAHGDVERTPMSAHQAGVTATHEIGHLLGAEHSQANCAEGLAPRPCTVMTAFSHSRADVNSTVFGTLERTVVRGHAVAFAKP